MAGNRIVSLVAKRCGVPWPSDIAVGSTSAVFVEGDLESTWQIEPGSLRSGKPSAVLFGTHGAVTGTSSLKLFSMRAKAGSAFLRSSSADCIATATVKLSVSKV